MQVIIEKIEIVLPSQNATQQMPEVDPLTRLVNDSVINSKLVVWATQNDTEHDMVEVEGSGEKVDTAKDGVWEISGEEALVL